MNSLWEKFGGYMIRDSSENKSLYYLTDFEVHDDVTYLKTEDKDLLLVSPLEASRAGKEASVDKVINTAKYTEGDIRDDREKEIDLIKKFLKDQNIEKLAVPEDFPLGLGDELRKEIELSPVNDFVIEERKIKSEEELVKLNESQKMTEKAMKHSKEILEASDIHEGKLNYEGEVLTSERLRKKIKRVLEDAGCNVPKESIVASGREGSDSHSIGKGPIKAGEPIIIDIFPRKDEYFGDMTRTFVKGEASEEVEKMHSAVEEALKQALNVIKAGVTTDEVHGKVCEVLENRGFKTLRQDKDTEEGFIHSTGHGVGLELHEPPRIAENDEELKEGMVLTIEPGLYFKDVGGIRIEDMIVVTEDGYENFNSMSYEL